MRVLFQSRVDLLQKKGGDTVQVIKTAEELRKLGVEVDLDCNIGAQVDSYDLVHVFQLDWVCESYLHVLNAKKAGKKVVLSPIHHSEKEVKQYEKEERYTFRRVSNIFITSQEFLDVLKNVYRSFFDLRKLYPTLLSIKDGFRNQQKKVLKMSDAILTQTDKEFQFLKRDFGVDISCVKIQLGVSDDFLNPIKKKYFDFSDYILTVGRIEPRKNQLKIIEAVKLLNKTKGLNLKLVIVGSLNSNNFEYYMRFNRLLKENNFVEYVPKVNYEDMPSVYNGAKVCVSGSYFETTGLTLIEAALSGTNVVARNGDTGEVVREYLGDIPEYCNPSSIESISEAIFRAYKKERPEISNEFRNKYTWANVAKETLKVYNELVK